MSKNGKGHGKQHSTGLGRRAYKKTLHLNSMGCGNAYGALLGIPLYTPVRHVSTKNGHVAQHVMEERLYQQHRAGYLVRLRKGDYLFEKDEYRQTTIREVVAELNQAGLVSKDWKGSNFHDRSRTTLELVAPETPEAKTEEAPAPVV